MKIQNQVSVADSVVVVPYIFHLYRLFWERRKFGKKRYLKSKEKKKNRYVRKEISENQTM